MCMQALSCELKSIEGFSPIFASQHSITTLIYRLV